ncbi:MAG: polysaccharide biosynthesis/export family protein [Bacteroidota bacterium]
MRERNVGSWFQWVTVSLFFIGLTGCAPQELFQTVDPAGDASLQQIQAIHPEPVLGPGDKITISIFGHNDLSIGSINTTFNANAASGRWVVLDSEGEVNLPKLGRVKLTGYNAKEASYYLEKLYAQHIKDPIINVKILNHYVTVLGEVNSPGRYNFENESLTLIELIGEAQGMTKFARETDVELIRMVDGQSVKARVDLTSFARMDDKNTSLRPGDIVYIPPRKKKRFGEAASQATPVVGVLSSIAIMITLFVR